MAGLQIGGGIAGVASTVERTGIKIYNEKSKYNEWEFIYDLTKDTKGMAGTTGIAGAPQQGSPSPSGQQTPPTQMPSPYTGQPPGGNQPPVVQQQQFQPTWLQPQPQPQQPQPAPPPPPPPQPISPP